MIDTIVLRLDSGMFYIKEPKMFEPPADWVLDNSMSLGGRGYIVSKQNPTKKELRDGFYKPRLSLTNRYNSTLGKRTPTLKIEFSLPKLLFGNNFDELVDDDFDIIFNKLYLLLKNMGVMVFEPRLLNASVSAVHYSKNIPLTDGTTPHYLIGKIREANVKLALDVDESNYRNDGYGYKWHASSYEIAFYDKIKDLEAAKISESRSFEKDNALQLGLFDDRKKPKRFEVLRIEVRLNKRQKLRQLFKKLGITSELTFKNLFSSTISQKVLLHYLDELERMRLPLMDYKASSPKALLADLIINNPQMKSRKLLQIVGLKLIMESVSPRELRAMLGKDSARTWYRLIEEAGSIKLPVSVSPFAVVRTHLNAFTPLKLVDFQG